MVRLIFLAFLMVVTTACSTATDNSDTLSDSRAVDLAVDIGNELPDTGTDLIHDGGTELPDVSADVPLDLHSDLLDLPDLAMDLPDLGTDLFPDQDDGDDAADGGCPECQVPDPVWALSLGGDKVDHLLSLAVTGNGDIYVGGKTQSEFFLVDDEIQGKNPEGDLGQIFVSKVLADGTPDWTRLMGGTGDDRLRGLGARSNGGVLAAGLSLSETLLLGTHEFTNQGHFDAYAVALAPDGQVDWALAYGGNKDEMVLSIAEDDDGNAFIGGYFSSLSLAIGDLEVANTLDKEQYDLLIIKLDANGVPLWARVLGSTGFDYVHSLEADAAGNVYFIGGISGSGMEVNGETLNTNGERDILAGKLSPDGEFLWVKSFGGAHHDAGHALDVSPGGDVYLTGSLQSQVVSFGGAPIEHVGSQETHDIFLVRLDTDGNHVWSKGFGGIDWDLSKCLSLDGTGGLYMVGAFKSPALPLGGEYLTGAGDGAAGVETFAAFYDTDGTHLWSKAYGGADHDIAYWVGAGGGTVAFAGTFNGKDDGKPSGTVDFGTGPLAVYGGRDSFVVRLK